MTSSDQRNRPGKAETDNQPDSATVKIRREFSDLEASIINVVDQAGKDGAALTNLLKKASKSELQSPDEKVETIIQSLRSLLSEFEQNFKNISNLEQRLQKQDEWHKENVDRLRLRISKMKEFHKETRETLLSQITEARQEAQLQRVENKRVVTAAREAARDQFPGDNLTETTGWSKIEAGKAPFVAGGSSRIRVLLLNSMGGSMSRLGKALLMHENIDADCLIAAYKPRRHLVYPHETNVHGIFDHDEWRDYLGWAVKYYDIIQSTTLPLAPAVARCYDWLTETLGRRHIWRSTGFVHHYLKRPDILPLEVYQGDLNTDSEPGPDKFAGKTFEFTENSIKIDPNVMFYCCPEKGAYFEGRDKIWLPSIRDPEQFEHLPRSDDAERKRKIWVYVPHHPSAIWKGTGYALAALEEIQKERGDLVIVTAENAVEMFPDLVSPGAAAKLLDKDLAYPIPNHLMPELFRRVDFVVDQVVMGAYGNTGIEAMMCGKPVVGQKKFPEISDSPVWPVELDTLAAGIRAFLERRDEWEAMGLQSREHAVKFHSPQAVARIAADTYRRVLDEQ